MLPLPSTAYSSASSGANAFAACSGASSMDSSKTKSTVAPAAYAYAALSEFMYSTDHNWLPETIMIAHSHSEMLLIRWEWDMMNVEQKNEWEMMKLIRDCS